MQFQLTMASYLPIHTLPARPVQVISNHLVAEVDCSPKKSPKYKKVGKTTKDQLLDLVEQGSSIVSAARKLGINYSTAKSIIQLKNKDSTKKVPCESTDESNFKEALALANKPL